MNFIIISGALELGGIFALLSLGLFISFKVLNIPDLTVDGSFTVGCAVSAVTTLSLSPLLGILFAFISGVIAGVFTGLLITKLKINPILSGILTQTALYSLNLRIMNQTPNISLLDKSTIFTPFESENGIGKISKSTEFNVINRGGKGVKVAKVTKKTGKIVAVKSITGNEDLMIMTDQGIIIRIDISTISTLGRTATGVKVINLVDDQKVATVTLAEKEENYEDD